MKTTSMPVCALAFALAVSACQRPSEETIFELSGRIFVFNYRTAEARYLLTFDKVAELQGVVAAKAEFENPQGGNPHRVSIPVLREQTRLVIDSPALECVRKERPYKVSVEFTDAGGKTLAKIETSVTSQLDHSTLPLVSPVIGSGYDRNEAAYDAQGNLKMRSMQGCPQ